MLNWRFVDCVSRNGGNVKTILTPPLNPAFGCQTMLHMKMISDQATTISCPNKILFLFLFLFFFIMDMIFFHKVK